MEIDKLIEVPFYNNFRIDKMNNVYIVDDNVNKVQRLSANQFNLISRVEPKLMRFDILGRNQRKSKWLA